MLKVSAIVLQISVGFEGFTLQDSSISTNARVKHETLSYTIHN